MQNSGVIRLQKEVLSRQLGRQLVQCRGWANRYVLRAGLLCVTSTRIYRDATLCLSA